MGNIFKNNKCAPEFLKLKPKVQIENLNHALSELTDDAHFVIYCRFWDCMTIEEISNLIGKSWDETDSLIESTLSSLKSFLTSNRCPQNKMVA